MKKILSGFGLFTGATYPLRAFYFLSRKPHLWQYLVIPVIVNLIVGIALYLAVLFPSWDFTQDLVIQFSQWLNQLIIDLPSWLGFLTYFIIVLGWIIKAFIIVLLFLLIGFVLVQFGSILGAPWYGKLSEELEKIKTGKVEVVEVNILVDIWRAILFEIKKLGLLFTFGFPLLLINFIPTFGNLISVIGGVALTATIVCLDFIDAPLERRRLSFKQKLSVVKKGLPATAGFSLVCLGLISIPFINLISIPLCVASGTLFFCDFLHPLSHQLQSRNK